MTLQWYVWQSDENAFYFYEIQSSHSNTKSKMMNISEKRFMLDLKIMSTR